MPKHPILSLASCQKSFDHIQVCVKEADMVLTACESEAELSDQVVDGDFFLLLIQLDQDQVAAAYYDLCQRIINLKAAKDLPTIVAGLSHQKLIDFAIAFR